MITTELRQLLAHMEWADATVWSAVAATPAASADARLRDLLVHVHTVQWAYLQLWRGEPISIPAPETLPDAGAVRRWARVCHAQAREFVAALDETALERPIQFPWAEQLVGRFGEVHPTTLRQAMIQVAMHSAHHRGQICTRLREAGGEPPLVDFVGWVWMGLPDPAWPVVSA